MRKEKRHSFFERSALGGDIGGAVRSDINVTPFVDVVLVLLIIFMVVTPLLANPVPVALPETKSPDAVKEDPKQRTVSVKTDGTIFLDQTIITEAGLKTAFEELYLSSPEADIVIRGDARVKYKRVREVMKIINQAGFKNVGLISTKIKTGAAAAG